MSSYKLLKSFPFSSSVLQQFSIDGEILPLTEHAPLGGFFCDSKYIWLSKGPVLQIISTASHSKVSEWFFGNVLKDNTIYITSVAEIPRKSAGLPFLAVGLHSNIIGGFICIFDVALAKVIRTIDVKYNVSSVIFVEIENGSVPLPGPLRAFDGVLAVGLNGGDVLLIDLCWQILDEVGLGNADVKDELNPCEMVILQKKDVSKIDYFKERSIRKGLHLAIHLNYVPKDPSQHFQLKAPNGDTIVLVNSAEVAVSALHYCSQLGSILVGYNFGALQLWDIINMELVYTSPVYEKNIPVSHFAIQEPSDDPKAFCYIWAVYSSTEPFIDDFPVAALYSFTYTTKEFHEGYGYLYEGFISCRVRFQMDLMLPDDYVPVRKPKGAWCVGLEALNKNRNTTIMELPEDNLVICCFVWTVWCSNTETYTYNAVFDLNQWYKEQMPCEPQWNDCGSYLMHKRISTLYEKENGIVLASTVKSVSISQFMGVQRLEEHYYPSSLSFDFNVLRDKDCSLIAVRGVQKTFLQELQSTGPLSLLQPLKLYQEVINLGLCPLFTDIPSDNSMTENDQRKLLLNVALEQQMLNWLCSCAREWANGSFSSASCTLDLLLNWAWERALVLKNNADNLCLSLFDYSGLKLDANSQPIVNCCCRQLANLHIFLCFILDKLKPFVYNYDVVHFQSEKLHMVSTYFEVLQWLINVKLLPECSDVDNIFENLIDSVPYPVEVITTYYDKRRRALLDLCTKRFGEKYNLLFIDNLTETYCGGFNLQKMWKEVEGNGSYPPPSLQALLRTYLVENAEMSHKHSLVIYVFLDLAMVLNQDRYTETITQLIKFPAVFKLSQSLIKITQAFWQLDHEDFSTAVEHLLDPLVLDSDLKLWHHRIVLKALLVQEQYNFGLLYIKTRNPPLVDEDDFKLAISFYIANTMIDNAFYLLRKSSNSKPKDKLLMHLFSECVRFEKIREILNYPLSLEEETAFFAHLDSIHHPYVQDIRIFYNITKSRFFDAYELNTRAHLDKFSMRATFSEERATFRDSMIAAYKKLMPEVSQNLLSSSQKERKRGIWKEVSKPPPKSVFVHDTTETIKYKSAKVNINLPKTMDTWTHPILRDDLSKTEEPPYLGTPKIQLKRKRKMTPTVIEPSIITDVTDEGLSPPKRVKLEKICETFMKKFDSPIIKRKCTRLSSRISLDGENVCTPQSILKVGNLVKKLDEITTSRGESTTPEDLNEIVEEKAEDEGVLDDSASNKRFSFGLTPRRSISRLDNHTVRFSGLTTKSRNVSHSLQEKISPEESFHTVKSASDNSKLAEEKETKEGESQRVENDAEKDNVDTTDVQNSCTMSPKRRRSLHNTQTPVRHSPRLTKRLTPSESSSSGLLTPQESSTPISITKPKRMSLQQKVLTQNALKALTPKSRTIEMSYSTTGTVTTKIKTSERTEESMITSVVEKKDIVVEEETTKTQEHSESSKVTIEKSICDYSEDNITFDKYDNSYKELSITDSIFQSDVEDTKATEAEPGYIEMETSTEEEQNPQNQEIETETDPTFNIYESPQESPPIDNPPETVLTEMPIMSQEQYSAMEENDFDELHEEYFDEDLIVQEYLSPSFKSATSHDDTERTEPTISSEVIEINSSSSGSSSSVSDKESDESSRFNSSDSINESKKRYDKTRTESDGELERSYDKTRSESDEESERSYNKTRSESDYESEGSNDKDVLGVEREDQEKIVEEVVLSDVSEERNSSASETENVAEIVYNEDTQEIVTYEYKEVSKEGEEEYLHLTKMPVEQSMNYKRTTLVIEESEDVYEKEQEIMPTTDVLEVDLQNVVASTSSEEIPAPVSSPSDERNREIVEHKKTEFDFDTSKKAFTQQSLPSTKEDKEQEVENRISNESKLQDRKSENQEKFTSTLIPSMSNNDKSDLEFSVISDAYVSRNSETFLHKTPLNFSVEYSKSDLDFSLASDEVSLHVSRTASTSYVEESEKQVAKSTPRTRSKSTDVPELQERRTLRKRSASVNIETQKPKSGVRVAKKLLAILERDEEGNAQGTKRRKKAQSTSGVLDSRPITRRQKSLLKKAATEHEGSSDSEDDKRGPALTPIDPMQLLHKPSFKGKPDPEEANMHSSNTELHSINETGTPRRSFRKSKTISPPPLTIKTRSRTKSVDLPPQETNRRTRSTRSKGDDNESVTSERSTRSRSTRAASVSSIKSDTAAIQKKKQNPPRKSQKGLSKVTEEEIQEVKPSRRITRATSSKI